MEQSLATKMHISFLNFLHKNRLICLQRTEEKLQRTSYTMLKSCIYWIRLANNKFTFLGENVGDDILYKNAANFILGIGSGPITVDETKIIKHAEKKYKDEINRIKSNYKDLVSLYVQVNCLKTLNYSDRINHNKRFALSRTINKFCKRTYIDFKHIQEIIADKRANPQKIDLKKVLHSILEFFPILGVLILFGGFLYQCILLGLFPTNTVNYSSSVTNYITYSFKAIVGAILFVALPYAFGAYKSAVDKARLHKKIIEKQNRQNRWIKSIIILISTVGAVLILFGIFLKKIKSIYVILPDLLCFLNVFFMILVFTYIPKFLQRYFKISQGMIVSVCAAILFFSAIMRTAISDGVDIKNGTGKTITKDFASKK
jgi:hypothetical protein